MNAEQIETIRDVIGDLRTLAATAGQAPQPTRAIMETAIFLAVQKLRFVLGDDGGGG